MKSPRKQLLLPLMIDYLKTGESAVFMKLAEHLSAAELKALLNLRINMKSPNSLLQIEFLQRERAAESDSLPL